MTYEVYLQIDRETHKQRLKKQEKYLKQIISRREKSKRVTNLSLKMFKFIKYKPHSK